MFTTVTPVSSATTLGRESISRTPKSSAPMKMKLSFSPGLSCSRSIATVAMTTKIATPAVSSTARVRTAGT